MTGIWLVSYLVLWLVVVAMGFLLVGAMRQIGLLHLERNQSFATTDPPPPPVEEDGPAIGSRISTLAAKTINNFGTVTLANRDGSVIIGTERCSGRTLLVFLSALCDNCQLAAEPLNVLAADAERGVRPIVVLRADEHACQAFISVFPLRLPTICDATRVITMGFGVHRAPFGLLYDESGTLIRKGIVEGHEDLLALLGDQAAPVAARAHVFPQLASVDGDG